jgi:polysaccharide pyruvyl transferase WcaK-like protein
MSTPSRPASFNQTTHLELRFGERTTGTGALLDAARLPRVKTLEVRLRGSDRMPGAAMIMARLVERLPALQGLTLRFVGTADPSHITLAVDLRETCAGRGLTLAVEFILEADANAFDALGQYPGSAAPTSLTAVLEASRGLRVHRVPVRWIVPLMPTLVCRLEALFSLARDEGVDPVLAPPEAALDDEDRLFVSDFITYRLLEEDRHLHSADRNDTYRALRHELARVSRCMRTSTRNVAVLYAVDTQPGIRWTVEYEERPSVRGPAEESQRPSFERFATTRAGRLMAQAIDVGMVLVEGGSALAQWLRAGLADLTGARGKAEPGEQFARVLLIGAYGGEHIGDAAILGGVLFRMNRRYGTTEALLMSQRPAHTRHLISMLETPFKIDVEAYEQSKIRERVPRVDAVVFAGGPLIDLPKQLVKHFYAVSLARRRNKPFIVEGIGPGPFPRWPSEWIARRIVRMAERISVRTSIDAGARLMKGLTPEVGRDPAFDYLATRGPEPSRLREADRLCIERLLRNTEGRLVIGVNLRPIRHLFTVGVSARKRAEYTRFVETRFEVRLAAGMRRFHEASSRAPCFIFFPMNAVQFGMSDLRSAYRLQRVLRGQVDFRVWEADASLDGVIALLRRLDMVICMRFHAAVFALAQQRRVIGIDYRVGTRDKVAALLDDWGQTENCCRIDELTSEWLFRRLSAGAAT